MAQKKKSKKDLEQRVGKLKKKVSTLTSGLSKKQSNLSRTLSSVQKKLDKLRTQKPSGKKLESLGKLQQKQGKRQQKLSRTTEKLVARLHDLEQTVSIVERAGDELRARTDALETTAAESAHRGYAAEHLAGEPDGSLQHVVELLRDRTQSVEDQLERLSAAQESLELQIALLSREAEESTGLSSGLDTPAEKGPGWAERANELAAQIQDVQNSIADESHDSGVLRARAEQLEASGSELSEIHRVLQGRVEKLEQLGEGLQPDAGSGEVAALARQIPELRTQCSQADEATGKLSRRTAVLEAGHETLTENDQRITAQLESVEQRLAEIAGQTGGAGSGPAKIPQALEQQIALLSTDRSLNQSRIDEVLKRADSLEKTRFNYTRHTDALADRITTLNDRLDKLDAEARLEALDGRSNALEQLLRKEGANLGELAQAEATLDQRLNAAIGDAQALEDRLNELSAGSERLNNEVDRLDAEFQSADEKAKQQHDVLQTHAARLEQQRVALDEAVALNRKSSDGLNTRLGTLDDSRQTLQDATDSLRVQQVRQDHETQNLQQKLKRRTLLGLLMLLLIAGGLVYLLMRGPMVSQGIQSAMQAASSMDEQAAAAIATLQKDMSEFRRELSALGESLEQVSRSVDEISDTAAPVPPEQLSQLTETVETLSLQDQRQQQESEVLRQGQEQQLQENAELQKSQQQLQADIDRIAEEVKALEQRVNEKPADVAPAKTTAKASTPIPTRAPAQVPAQKAAGQAWVQARASGRYTLQMAGFHQPESLAWFIGQHDLGSDSAVYHTEFQGRKWYVVLHGVYDSIAQAVAATSQLPPELAAQNPWVRRIPKTGDLFQL